MRVNVDLKDCRAKKYGSYLRANSDGIVASNADPRCFFDDVRKPLVAGDGRGIVKAWT